MNRREIRTLLAEMRDQPPTQKTFRRLSRLGIPPVDKLRFVWPSLLSHRGRSWRDRDLKAKGLGFVPADHILHWSLCVGVCDMSFRPRDLAGRMAGQPDGYVRETFSLPREQARAKAKAFLRSYPKAAYMSEVERWRELPDGAIEFTMRRLRTAD
jgi:hypothetical protein